jgi:hypothetical protein
MKLVLKLKNAFEIGLKLGSISQFHRSDIETRGLYLENFDMLDLEYF